jgi:hypothetical protein
MPPLAPQPLHTPSPNVLDDVASGGIKPENDTLGPPSAHADILNTFDPLEHHEEQRAREAWASAEGHPLPAPAPPPKQDPAPQASGSPSSFSSFSTFARSFALPSLPNVSMSLVAGTRGRPQSLDTATVVRTPVHPVSFAAQQDAAISSRGSPKMDAMTLPAQVVHDTLRRKEPSQERPGGKDKDPAFDFQKFLDQMKTKSAEPVARYLRSFLSNFAKRTFTVTDQVKLINDFLNFISQKMREADVWKSASDTEFDNAMEGMEKLVMNRLYDYTFTPQIAHANPPRPITTDDLERDRVLAQRIALFGWIEPLHLDVPTAEGSNGFLLFAQQELVKINHYKAPRDKLICILNCCKVIFGLIRHLNSEESADTFVPILIYVVLKANPEHLLSNVEFINRFRNPTKLQSEAGYYLSSLVRPEKSRLYLIIPNSELILRRWGQSHLLKPWTIHRYLVLRRRNSRKTLRLPSKRYHPPARILHLYRPRHLPPVRPHLPSIRISPPSIGRQPILFQYHPLPCHDANHSTREKSPRRHSPCQA